MNGMGDTGMCQVRISVVGSGAGVSKRYQQKRLRRNRKNNVGVPGL